MIQFGIVPGHPKAVELTTASGAGGDTACDLRPAAGHAYIVLAARAYQDDAARTIEWIGQIDSTAYVLSTSTLNASTDLQLYTSLPSPVPFILTRSCYLQFKVCSMAAAKNVYVKLWVHEISGIQSVA